MTAHSPFTAGDVVAFLHHFEELAGQEDFALIRDLIDERAVFRFNDGDFVGRDAIQAVFETTWRGDPSVKRARLPSCSADRSWSPSMTKACDSWCPPTVPMEIRGTPAHATTLSCSRPGIETASPTSTPTWNDIRASSSDPFMG